MVVLPDIDRVTKIYESANSLVYRAIRKIDRQPIILKLLKEDYPTPQELIRYQQEYEITRSLQLEGVVQVYNLQPYQNTLVMTLEDFGGMSLDLLLPQHSLSLSEFLRLAIQITNILGKIHNANIIHKDINPSNIIWNLETDQLKIIDFGIATVLSRENATLKNPGVLEGTLAYISPEQTGRMNRAIDYRADFYSLGVTFYELLTNRLPFETTDAMELIHCHLAKQPIPPCSLPSSSSPPPSSSSPLPISPSPHPSISSSPYLPTSSTPYSIPQVLSDIVMKLMAKNAEDRYQSAWGIKADLETCLQQLETIGQIVSFPLGKMDVSDRFQLPQKLYGRELQISQLLMAFEQVSEGQAVLMLVAGYSGVGKTTLIQEIYKPITQQRGYCISGKFDQLQREVPYSAVIHAFQKLIQQLLTESAAELQQWCDRLLMALGTNGQVMIDLIPDLERIIGSQPSITELAPNEAQNRFNWVLQNFIRVFCQKEHPLVLFLDDLQWADSATLRLLQLILTDPDTHFLFIIGAYRDNEVDTLID
jgi:serine/threonine protein kinase